MDWLQEYDINQFEFNIIKSSVNEQDYSLDIEILDVNFNKWFSFRIYDVMGHLSKKLTKHLTII